MSIEVNGVTLPDIPEDVLASYPYAVIVDCCLVHLSYHVYALFASDSPVIHRPASVSGAELDNVGIVNSECSYIAYECDGSTWEKSEDTVPGYLVMGEIYPAEGVTVTNNLIWANHNIYTATAMNEDGSFVIGTGVYFYDSTANYFAPKSWYDGIAQQVRRLTGTTEKLTTTAMLEDLKGVEVGSGGNTLVVTCGTGSTVTCSKDGETKTATEDNGTWTFTGLTPGVWTVTGTNGDTISTTEVEILNHTAEVFACDIVPWATGTDEQIAAMVNALDNGIITIEDTGWAVGDERTVTLSAMSAKGVGESHAEQSVTLVLMDSQHYTLTEATASGDTLDHFVVGLKNSLNEVGYMNASQSNSGSWSGSKRRAWCNNVFRAAIPETLRACFKQFKVPTATEYNGSTVTETDDYFALFAEKEVFGTASESNTTEAEALAQIKWYEVSANRKKTCEGAAQYWWLRSPDADDYQRFCRMTKVGTITGYYASSAYGISPFGCI